MRGEPWEQYDKDALPKGLAYPLGRDAVQWELERARASVSSLHFGRPDRHSAGSVLDIHWSGDVSRRVADNVTSRGFVLMTLLAVPVDDLRSTRLELRDEWLPRAARWVANIADSRDGWLASEHRWLLRRSADGLTLDVR